MRCVLPRTCVGALRIGEDPGLHWLREVKGGQLGQKSVLAPAAGDAVASRHCLWAGAGVGQGVIRRART